MPKWMDDCVKKVKKKNPKYNDQRVWAICTAAYKKEFGKAPPREDIAAMSLLEQTLTFSQSDKFRIIAAAVRARWIEMSDDPYNWPSVWVVDIYDDQQEVVVVDGDRLYALSYSFVDRFTVELGEPYEVVAAHVPLETESVHYVLAQAWVGKPLDELDDGDFAWLSTEYQEASAKERDDLPRHEHRQLPFAVHGAVHTDGWRAAWKMLQFESYMRPDLAGGPDRKACQEILEMAKPTTVAIESDGACMVTESVEGRSLTESYKSGLVVESAEPDSGFSYMVSGTVVPKPDTRFGTYSRNRRLYPEACIRESFDRSTTFLEEEVATIHISHMTAIERRHLPVGKLTELWMDSGAMKFRGGVADTSTGRDLRSLIESGTLDRVSLRTREWKSKYEEVGDLGRVEVMEWFVLSGMDFTEVPGLDGTRIVKEEETMDLKDLTLAELREARPDLIAEIVEGAAPEPTVEYQTPPEVALNVAILEASNTGTGSLVSKYLQERAKTTEDLTEELIQEARVEGAKALYARHKPAPASNLKGDATPAPPPDEGGEGGEEESLTESQREMVELAGGSLTE